jgi:hypothetical protein
LIDILAELAENKIKMINRISILIGCLAVSFSLFYCDSDDDCRIITEIDMEEMANIHLPDFHMIDQHVMDSLSTMYTFAVEDSSLLIFRVGIFQSEVDAQDFAINTSKYTSAGMTEGPYLGVSVGDKFLWNTYTTDHIILGSIVFTRKNAFILIDAIRYEDVMTLASKIDNDIVNGASYIQCIN